MRPPPRPTVIVGRRIPSPRRYFTLRAGHETLRLRSGHTFALIRLLAPRTFCHTGTPVGDYSPTELDARALGVRQCPVFRPLTHLPGTSRLWRKTQTQPAPVSSRAVLSRPARREERRRGDRPGNDRNLGR